MVQTSVLVRMLRFDIHKMSSETFGLIILMNIVFISVVEESDVKHDRRGRLSISKKDLEASRASFIITLRADEDLDKYIYLIDTFFSFFPGGAHYET